MTTKIHQKILFLCTGNYYRSRFAQHLFNALADKQGLHWDADSRGLAIERGINNRGAISPYAVQGLKKCGFLVPENERFPLQVVETDFAKFDKIVALDKFEHHPIMVERFSRWVDIIEYWDVHDLDQTFPPFALKQIEQHIIRLIDLSTKA